MYNSFNKLKYYMFTRPYLFTITASNMNKGLVVADNIIDEFHSRDKILSCGISQDVASSGLIDKYRSQYYANLGCERGNLLDYASCLSIIYAGDLCDDNKLNKNIEQDMIEFVKNGDLLVLVDDKNNLDKLFSKFTKLSKLLPSANRITSRQCQDAYTAIRLEHESRR